MNVHGLIATTHKLSNEDFLKGQYRFTQGQTNAAVINNGTINASSYVGLLGSAVENNGLINATLGTVALAGGSAATLDFVGDGLISFAVTEATQGDVKDLDGNVLNDIIHNTGQLKANGGKVVYLSQMIS